MSKPNGQSDTANDGDAAENSEPKDRSAPPSSTRQNSTAVAKWILVCPNGGRYNKPKKLILPTYLRNRWDGILQSIDDKTPIVGGCFHVFRADDNEYTEVHSFDELMDGDMYVALNNSEKLIKMDYKALLNSSRSPSPSRRSQQSTASRSNQKRKQLPAVSKYTKQVSYMKVNLYANGRYHSKHHAILEPPEVYERYAKVFKNAECPAIEFVYRQIEDSCYISLKGSQSIQKMVDTKDGHVITEPREIENGGTYVLCGHEDYVPFNGPRALQPLMFSRYQREPTRYLHNPRSSKGGRMARGGQGGETNRTQRESRASGERSNGDQRDPYASESQGQNQANGQDRDPYDSRDDREGDRNGWQNDDNNDSQENRQESPTQKQETDERDKQEEKGAEDQQAAGEQDKQSTSGDRNPQDPTKPDEEQKETTGEQDKQSTSGDRNPQDPKKPDEEQKEDNQTGNAPEQGNENGSSQEPAQNTSQ